jgi:hypothetical protein
MLPIVTRVRGGGGENEWKKNNNDGNEDRRQISKQMLYCNIIATIVVSC